jgi:nitrilase
MDLPVINIAAIQAEPVPLDREASTEKVCRLTAEAASNGAHLVVFSEMFIPVFTNASIWGRGFAKWGSGQAPAAFRRLWNNSVEIPSPTTDRLAEVARDTGVMLAVGVCERVANTRTLFNTILFVGPEGVIGKHRKLVPTNTERLIHGFGDGSTLTVLDTPVGRIGGLICWENLMPLARYALYSQGEQIHLAPTSDDSEMGVVNARNTALEGGVFVVSVPNLIRKSNYPPDFEFADELAAVGEYIIEGGACIIAPDGGLLAGPVFKDEVILYAEVDLNETLGAGQLLDAVGHYARPEVLALRFNREPYNSVIFEA